ncbi:MAG: helix-turn-helix transcriptional regulator [Clostridium sp.]|uniref:helix-turn-helix domain-containing protein n=1 Tax=Clostridium sp. TaxID=1506 RepID=UPI00290FABE4|nr:helix-turn-helix transcriptional regulator [Clostridium sp.]MBS6503110.1 helix-turn-helix transcriptional regulator [Clostridium sp.]MDU3549075.1 helix-turn-helix transcriptional regulator [Clostridium sp.]
MNIGERIKERRKELGLSVDDVATKLNKNRATVYRYESNDIENLPLNILEPLAKVLQTTPAYLMGWDTVGSSEITVSKDELALLTNYKKLNPSGKGEAIKRVEELTYITKYIEQENNIIDLPKKEKQIWEEPGKEYLMPIACHDDNLTEEEKAIVNEKINEILNNLDKY